MSPRKRKVQGRKALRSDAAVVNALVWEAAKELAGGDLRRIRILSDTSVVVLNQPGGRA